MPADLLPALLGGPPACPEGPPYWPLPDPAVRDALLAAWPTGSWGQYQGRPVFVISISRDLNGVDPHQPQIRSKEDECANLTGSPEPREVNP